MKLTIEKIVNDQPAIINLLALKLPVKISYRLSKLSSKLIPKIKHYNEERFKLIKNLGTCTDVKMDSWEVSEENMPKFKEDFKILNEMEEEFDFEPINIDELAGLSVEGKNLTDWIFV